MKISSSITVYLIYLLVPFLAFDSVVAQITSSTNVFSRNLNSTDHLGRKGLCVIGCTPYVNLTNHVDGLSKYNALVAEMAQTCDIIVHVGDTKTGHMPCMYNFLTKALEMLLTLASHHQTIALYAPGDNEISDCYRAGSSATPVPADIYKASDARQYLVQQFDMAAPTDLTKAYYAEQHFINEILPGTNRTYSCDFDRYVALDYYAVASMEVLGDYWYLLDERKTGYPLQNSVDPLQDRLSLFLNARKCTLDWIEQSAAKASATGKRVLFLTFQALFDRNLGEGPLENTHIGEYYNTENLSRLTKELTGQNISDPYTDLFNQLTSVALQYPNLMFYVVHADGHKFQTMRMNPTFDNRPGELLSNQNLMIHMVEGDSRALTMFSRFTVDPQKFQPVAIQQEWSKAAYDAEPVGHTWIPYIPPY